jgi:hypothetical protein
MYPHTVTQDNGIFDSGIVQPGGAYSYTFQNPGTYPYYCMLHGRPGGIGMAGIIVVVASSTAPLPYYNYNFYRQYPYPYSGSGYSDYYFQPGQNMPYYGSGYMHGY